MTWDNLCAGNFQRRVLSTFSLRSLLWPIVFVCAVAWASFRFDGLNERLVAVRHDLEKVWDEAKLTKDAVGDITAVRGETQRALEHAEAAIQSLAGDLGSATNRLSKSETEREALQVELTQAVSKVSAMAAELKQSEENLISAREDLQKKQARVEALEEKLAVIETARGKAVRKHAQIETARAVAEFEAFTAEEELEEIKAKLTFLEAAKADAEGKASACNIELEALAAKTSVPKKFSQPEKSAKAQRASSPPAEETPSAGSSTIKSTPELNPLPAL